MRFPSILKLHWSPLPIKFFYVTKPGSNCHSVPLKAPEKSEEDKQEATKFPAAAEEVCLCYSSSSFIKTGWLFVLKEKQKMTLNMFSLCCQQEFS